MAQYQQPCALPVDGVHAFTSSPASRYLQELDWLASLSSKAGNVTGPRQSHAGRSTHSHPCSPARHSAAHVLHFWPSQPRRVSHGSAGGSANPTPWSPSGPGHPLLWYSNPWYTMINSRHRTDSSDTASLTGSQSYADFSGRASCSGGGTQPLPATNPLSQHSPTQSRSQLQHKPNTTHAIPSVLRPSTPPRTSRRATSPHSSHPLPHSSWAIPRPSRSMPSSRSQSPSHSSSALTCTSPAASITVPRPVTAPQAVALVASITQLPRSTTSPQQPSCVTTASSGQLYLDRPDRASSAGQQRVMPTATPPPSVAYLNALRGNLRSHTLNLGPSARTTRDGQDPLAPPNNTPHGDASSFQSTSGGGQVGNRSVSTSQSHSLADTRCADKQASPAGCSLAAAATTRPGHAAHECRPTLDTARQETIRAAPPSAAARQHLGTAAAATAAAATAVVHRSEFEQPVRQAAGAADGAWQRWASRHRKGASLVSPQPVTASGSAAVLAGNPPLSLLPGATRPQPSLSTAPHDPGHHLGHHPSTASRSRSPLHALSRWLTGGSGQQQPSVHPMHPQPQPTHPPLQSVANASTWHHRPLQGTHVDTATRVLGGQSYTHATYAVSPSIPHSGSHSHVAQSNHGSCGNHLAQEARGREGLAGPLHAGSHPPRGRSAPPQLRAHALESIEECSSDDGGSSQEDTSDHRPTAGLPWTASQVSCAPRSSSVGRPGMSSRGGPWAQHSNPDPNLVTAGAAPVLPALTRPTPDRQGLWSPVARLPDATGPAARRTASRSRSPSGLLHASPSRPSRDVSPVSRAVFPTTTHRGRPSSPGSVTSSVTSAQSHVTPWSPHRGRRDKPPPRDKPHGDGRRQQPASAQPMHVHGRSGTWATPGRPLSQAHTQWSPYNTSGAQHATSGVPLPQMWGAAQGRGSPVREPHPAPARGRQTSSRAAQAELAWLARRSSPATRRPGTWAPASTGTQDKSRSRSPAGRHVNDAVSAPRGRPESRILHHEVCTSKCARSLGQQGADHYESPPRGDRPSTWGHPHGAQGTEHPGSRPYRLTSHQLSSHTSHTSPVGEGVPAYQLPPDRHHDIPDTSHRSVRDVEQHTPHHSPAVSVRHVSMATQTSTTVALPLVADGCATHTHADERQGLGLLLAPSTMAGLSSHPVPDVQSDSDVMSVASSFQTNDCEPARGRADVGAPQAGGMQRAGKPTTASSREAAAAQRHVRRMSRTRDTSDTAPPSHISPPLRQPLATPLFPAAPTDDPTEPLDTLSPRDAYQAPQTHDYQPPSQDKLWTAFTSSGQSTPTHPLARSVPRPAHGCGGTGAPGSLAHRLPPSSRVLPFPAALGSHNTLVALLAAVATPPSARQAESHPAIDSLPGVASVNGECSPHQQEQEVAEQAVPAVQGPEQGADLLMSHALCQTHSQLELSLSHALSTPASCTSQPATAAGTTTEQPGHVPTAGPHPLNHTLSAASQQSSDDPVSHALSVASTIHLSVTQPAGGGGGPVPSGPLAALLHDAEAVDHPPQGTLPQPMSAPHAPAQPGQDASRDRVELTLSDIVSGSGNTDSGSTAAAPGSGTRNAPVLPIPEDLEHLLQWGLPSPSRSPSPSPDVQPTSVPIRQEPQCAMQHDMQPLGGGLATAHASAGSAHDRWKGAGEQALLSLALLQPAGSPRGRLAGPRKATPPDSASALVTTGGSSRMQGPSGAESHPVVVAQPTHRGPDSPAAEAPLPQASVPRNSQELQVPAKVAEAVPVPAILSANKLADVSSTGTPTVAEQGVGQGRGAAQLQPPAHQPVATLGQPVLQTHPGAHSAHMEREGDSGGGCDVRAHAQLLPWLLLPAAAVLLSSPAARTDPPPATAEHSHSAMATALPQHCGSNGAAAQGSCLHAELPLATGADAAAAQPDDVCQPAQACSSAPREVVKHIEVESPALCDPCTSSHADLIRPNSPQSSPRVDTHQAAGHQLSPHSSTTRSSRLAPIKGLVSHEVFISPELSESSFSTASISPKLPVLSLALPSHASARIPAYLGDQSDMQPHAARNSHQAAEGDVSAQATRRDQEGDSDTTLLHLGLMQVSASSGHRSGLLGGRHVRSMRGSLEASSPTSSSGGVAGLEDVAWVPHRVYCRSNATSVHNSLAVEQGVLNSVRELCTIVSTLGQDPYPGLPDDVFAGCVDPVVSDAEYRGVGVAAEERAEIVERHQNLDPPRQGAPPMGSDCVVLNTGCAQQSSPTLDGADGQDAGADIGQLGTPCTDVQGRVQKGAQTAGRRRSPGRALVSAVAHGAAGVLLGVLGATGSAAADRHESLIELVDDEDWKAGEVVLEMGVWEQRQVRRMQRRHRQQPST